jgi:hypothetical protein
MRKIYFFVLTLVLFTACKSPTKLYEQGNYNDAFEAALKKLQKDPYDAEYRDVLKRSYHDAIADHEDRIRTLSNATSDTRYEQIYQHYDALQGLYEKIRRYPILTQYVKPIDYSSSVQTYKDKSADAHLEKAEKWMAENDKRSYREAYREYAKALRYRYDDFDIKKKMQEAYDLAVTKILLIPIDAFNSSYSYSNNSYQMRQFQDAIMRSLNNNSGNDFTRFYTEWEARGTRIEPDEVVEMRMGRMNIGQPYDSYNNRQVSKEVVVKETVYKKDSIVKEYAKVYATVTTTRRTLVSDVDIYLTTREPKGRILWSDNLRSEHKWQVDFSTYTGDERALSQSDKDQLKERDKKVPTQDEIADQLMRRLESEVSYRLRNYYSRFQ